MPYFSVYQQDYRGVIPKIPDLFYAKPFNNGKTRFGGAFLELKSPFGSVDTGQRKLLARLIRNNEYFVAVVHGHIEAIKLLNLYKKKDQKTGLNTANLEDLEKLAWCGDTKKEWILSVI